MIIMLKGQDSRITSLAENVSSLTFFSSDVFIESDPVFIISDNSDPFFLPGLVIRLFFYFWLSSSSIPFNPYPLLSLPPDTPSTLRPWLLIRLSGNKGGNTGVLNCMSFVVSEGRNAESVVCILTLPSLNVCSFLYFHKWNWTLPDSLCLSSVGLYVG